MVTPWNNAPYLINQGTIGEGGFGKVFKAYSALEDKTYAIKQISVQRFKRHHYKNYNYTYSYDGVDRCIPRLVNEVVALARLKNDHVVQYYSCWFEGPQVHMYNTKGISEVNLETDPSSNQKHPTKNNFLYIRMGFCNFDLRKWLRARSSHKDRIVEAIHEIFRQILNGLKYIHKEGIIHRDLKPENILICVANGSMKIQIGDFGLAAHVFQSMNENQLSTDSHKNKLGTRYYRSPEMERKDSDYDFKTDIFSTGLIFFECIEPSLIDNEKHHGVLMKIQYGNYTFPERRGTRFPNEMDLVKMMTEGDKNKRPSADEALKFMEKHMSHSVNETSLCQIINIDNEEPASKTTDVFGQNTLPWTNVCDLIYQEKIGRGGFGSVYKAFKALDRTTYAVKKISVEKFKLYHYRHYSGIEGWISRLCNEVKALAKLTNNHVVPYHFCWFEGPLAPLYNTGNINQVPSESFTSGQADKFDNFFCIQMGFCNLDLRKWLEARPSHETRSMKEMHIIFRQILKGLRYIHSEGLAHRDIKPENIMIIETEESIQIQITDFDFATPVLQGENKNNLPQEDYSTRGTRFYRSPEIEYGNESIIDFKKCDIFSTGLVFLECLDPNLNDVERRHLLFSKINYGKFTFPEKNETEFPNEMDLIKMMTEIDKNNRPDAQEALDYLSIVYLLYRVKIFSS